MGGFPLIRLLATSVVAIVFTIVPAYPQTDSSETSTASAGEAAEEGEEGEEKSMTIEEFEATLDFRTGTIELGGGIASMDVPEGFRYLNPDQSETILVNIWGNPKGEKSLGMLFPSDVSPFAEDGWGIIITFDQDGYVNDDDAATLDYDDLLKQMQESTREANAQREKQGYEPVEFVGWAEPPRYDPQTHKLYWAKNLKFGDAERNTLNYNIRVLGRKGVLVLNAVAGMHQLGDMKGEMDKVIGFVAFNDGHKYTDFDPGLDEVAAYGIGGLIAGKVALKAGLFKGLIALLLASKKFVILGAIALFALLKKLFTGRLGEDSVTTEAAGE
jgi:uncharacterized membrane-anchored protein